MTTASTLKAIRQVHHFSGVFLAPAILFFAITGGLQMFGLHETSRGSSYIPPAILVHLAQLHKHGTLAVPPRRPQPGPPGAPAVAGKQDGAAPKPDATPKLPDAAPKQPDSAPKHPDVGPNQPSHNPLPIKIFFALTAIGLVVSTTSGLIMAWKFTRRKTRIVGTLVAGIVVPLLLLLF